MENTEIKKEPGTKLLNESLFKAAARGSYRKARKLIGEGADINFQDDHGASVLMQAVIHDKAKIVRLLLDFNVDVDLTDNAGCTAYMKALEIGAECFILLGRHRADRQIRDEELIDAVRNDDIDLVRHYLSSGYNPDAMCYRRGESAIHLAVSNENLDLVKLLANAGADLNYISKKYNYTPLLLAIHIGASNSVIETLLELGADISLETDLGYTPLMYACRYRSLPFIRLLVESGADVDGSNSSLETPLMVSLLSDREDNLEVIKYLIWIGADVSTVDDNQNSVLMYLATEVEYKKPRSSLKECARILVENGVNVNAQNIDEESALLIAAKNNNVEVLCALIDLGADVNLPNVFGETALMLAGSQSENQSLNHETIKILINNGADISAVGPAGLIPIQYHAFVFDSKKHDLEIFKLLIGAGADIYFKNEDNESVIDIVNASKDKQLKGYFESILLKEYINDNLQDELVAGDVEVSTNRPML